MALQLEYEPGSHELRADPYGTYRALLAERPFHWNESLGAYVVVRHADCVQVLREPGWSVEDGTRMPAAKRPISPDERVSRSSFLGLDPPEHTRLRSLVSRTFTSRMIQRLRPRTEALVEESLDALGREGRVDFASSFAYSLPVTVIAELLGVPTADRERFRMWSSALSAGLDPVVAAGQRRSSLAAGRGLYDYLGTVIAARRTSPRDDLISDLVAAEEDGDRLTEQELRMLCIMILHAGHETTVGLLANGLLALLRSPDQLERLRDEPGLADRAVEELLRYDSPVQLTTRIAKEERVVAGHAVAPGHEVVALLGAANHDPEVFASPASLDITRDPNPHLSFSRGLHACLGAPLARLEAGLALPMLLQRFPDVRLDGVPEFRMTLTLRCVSRLPIAVRQ